jgi:hypothetical protein
VASSNDLILYRVPFIDIHSEISCLWQRRKSEATVDPIGAGACATGGAAIWPGHRQWSSLSTGTLECYARQNYKKRRIWKLRVTAIGEMKKVVALLCILAEKHGL